MKCREKRERGREEERKEERKGGKERNLICIQLFSVETCGWKKSIHFFLTVILTANSLNVVLRELYIHSEFSHTLSHEIFRRVW